MKALGTIAVCLAAALTPVTVQAKDSALHGDWETVQTCGAWSRSAVLKLRDGSKGRIKGSAQAEKRSRELEGWVDGRNFEVEASFGAPLDRRTRVKEVWTGKVSRDGKSIRGKFASSDPQDPGDCTFRGRRR